MTEQHPQPLQFDDLLHLSGDYIFRSFEYPDPMPRDVRERARCRAFPQVDFFDVEHSRWARSVCDGCPVRARCLEYAVEQGQMFVGMWGGHTDQERMVLRNPGGRYATTRPIQPVRVSTSYYSGGDNPDKARWTVSVNRYAQLANGKPIYCTRLELEDTLEGVWTQAEGVPTAQAALEEAMARVPEIKASKANFVPPTSMKPSNPRPPAGSGLSSAERMRRKRERDRAMRSERSESQLSA